jgi:hypothetical protein
VAQTHGLLSWGELSPEELAGHLVRVAERAFEPLRQITVENVLAPQGLAQAGLAPQGSGQEEPASPWDERSAQQWIGRLAELAAGAWNLDRALLPGGGADQASFLTIGVADATASIFGNSGYTLVSTHDPERIVALRTAYGVSFDALKPAVQWKRAYEQVGSRTRLHILWTGQETGPSVTDRSGDRPERD